ncbi:prevent-host-death family protein [Streptomyces sp. NPDC094448]
MLINPQELADPEDAPALALHRERLRSGGTAPVPHVEVRARLGLDPG